MKEQTVEEPKNATKLNKYKLHNKFTSTSTPEASLWDWRIMLQIASPCENASSSPLDRVDLREVEEDDSLTWDWDKEGMMGERFMPGMAEEGGPAGVDIVPGPVLMEVAPPTTP